MSIGTLVSKQNGDGGWPYLRGGSWTEPTVYSVMALLAAGETDAARRGILWIRGTQRSDGGWPARRGVDQSGWATGLVALLPPADLGADLHRDAIKWLLNTEGKETTRTYRLRQWLLGNPAFSSAAVPGWPWVPGTAAWVGPTSIAILALRNEQRRNPSTEVRRRIDQGQEFLLQRMCKSGGWNHGSSNALGYAAEAYPETTGMALTALRGSQSPKLTQAIGVARQFLAECHSADALNWLRAGLGAHDEIPKDFCAPQGLARRTVPETSLDLLVSDAQRHGRDPFQYMV